jgi:mono/diheme cytochrome c family protein
VKLCSQCHGSQGEGGVGPSLQSPSFQGNYSDQQIFDTINQGHNATAMIQWGDILSGEQIKQLVAFIRTLSTSQVTPPTSQAPDPTRAPGTLSFDKDILPIFTAKCNMCHGVSGGWDGTSYESAMSTGDHAPVIVPKDADNSLLAQKLLGTQTQGGVMPPFGEMTDEDIQIILNWIKGGALH